MLRIVSIIAAALLSLSSIAEAGEGGKVRGLRLALADGWAFECEAPPRWYSVEADEWKRLQSDAWAVTRDLVNGPHGVEWLITLKNKDGAVSDLVIRPYLANDDKPPAPVVEWGLCESKEKARIAQWGTIREDRFGSSNIIAAELVWIDPF